MKRLLPGAPSPHSPVVQWGPLGPERKRLAQDGWRRAERWGWDWNPGLLVSEPRSAGLGSLLLSRVPAP